MRKDLIWGLVCLLTILFVSPVMASTAEDDEEVSIADTRTFVTYYKREKKFKALVELLQDKLSIIDTACAEGNKEGCDLEGKLYILDDLADVYTYGLVDFQKAKDYNEQTRVIYDQLRAKGINTLPLSDYFNSNRFLYYSFYAKEGFLGGEESMDFTFNDKYIENVRQGDFDNTLARVAMRHTFLGEKLGGIAPVKDGISNAQVINKDLFLLYSAFIESSSSFSAFEKSFLKAQMAVQALAVGVSDQDAFVDAILTSRGFCEGQVTASDSLEKQDKINRLNYWLTLALMKKGDFQAALEHHEKLLAGIKLIEAATMKRYHSMSRMLQEQYRNELAEKNKNRLNGKKFIAGLTSAAVVIAKIGVTLLAAAGDAAAASQPGYNQHSGGSSLTEDTVKLLWEDKKVDYGVHESIMNAQFLSPVYTIDNNDSQRFSQFMAPYTLLLNRYLNKYEMTVYMLAIGEAYSLQNRPDKAVEQYGEAIEITERQRLTIYSENERVAYFGFKQVLYAKMIQALIGLNKIELALEYVERSKSRAFLDILGSDKITLKSSGQNKLANKYYQSRVELDSVLESAGIGVDQVAYAEETSLRGLEIVGSNLDDNSYDEIYSLSSVKVLESKKIQDLIDNDTAILEYYFTEGKLNIIVVRRDEMECVTVDVDHEDLIAKIGKLRQSIIELEYDRNTARELYKTLIAPVREHLKCERLVIIPHRGLHYLPFQALLSGKHYLIERYAISYVPSATVLSIVNKKKAPRNGRALVIGNPTGDLAYSEKEAIAIGEVLPDADVLLGDEGTETLLKNHAGGYKIIHIASHGLFDPERPLASRIMLYPSETDDGQLMTDELFSCRWRASLVTLSACQTGVSKYSSGDELIGLQRGVFFAGTQSLLASSWKVDDKSTSYLMTRFYKHLAKHTKDMALQKAQKDTIRRYSQPFHWASFQLVGASNRVYNPHYPLLVSADPDDAKIILVGIKEKYEPNVKLPAGKYQVRISKRGYEHQIVDVEIEESPVVLKVSLDRKYPKEEKGGASHSLMIETDPKDAMIILLNSRKNYRANIKLPAGEYQIRVSMKGYKPYTFWVNLNKDQKVKVKLSKK